MKHRELFGGNTDKKPPVVFDAPRPYLSLFWIFPLAPRLRCCSQDLNLDIELVLREERQRPFASGLLWHPVGSLRFLPHQEKSRNSYSLSSVSSHRQLPNWHAKITKSNILLKKKICRHLQQTFKCVFMTCGSCLSGCLMWLLTEIKQKPYSLFGRQSL